MSEPKSANDRIIVREVYTQSSPESSPSKRDRVEATISPMRQEADEAEMVRKLRGVDSNEDTPDKPIMVRTPSAPSKTSSGLRSEVDDDDDDEEWEQMSGRVRSLSPPAAVPRPIFQDEPRVGWHITRCVGRTGPVRSAPSARIEQWDDGSLHIRVDDENNPDFWLELHLEEEK